MNNVVLAWTHGNNVRPAFLTSVVKFQAQGNDHILNMLPVKDLILARGRNKVVRKFLETDAEWLWFLDTDIEFPIDAIDQLLDAAERYDCKILAAPYWNTMHNHNLVVWFDKSYYPYAKIPSQGIMRIHACGMGCTIIHREVFETMQNAWDSDDPWVWFGHDLVTLPSGKVDHIGEDFTFCLRANEHGFATYGLCDVVLEHWKLIPQPKDYLLEPEAELVSW